jgi:molybdenum cofactor biosynthesis enzyme MoaA
LRTEVLSKKERRYREKDFKKGQEVMRKKVKKQFAKSSCQALLATMEGTVLLCLLIQQGVQVIRDL